MIRSLKYLALAILIILAGLGIYSLLNGFSLFTSKEEVSATIIKERVEKVVKLVTVEGNFSEIYNYQHHYFADIWPFRKTALVKVDATVSVGYNMERLSITTDEATRRVFIRGRLSPEILSVDHDISNYNFNNGLFNMINDNDIAEMGKRAKDFIEEKAAESDLFDQAEVQRQELFEMLELALLSAGWELIVEDEKLLN